VAVGQNGINHGLSPRKDKAAVVTLKSGIGRGSGGNAMHATTPLICDGRPFSEGPNEGNVKGEG